MKGFLRLFPVKEPKEGMKVICREMVYKIIDTYGGKEVITLEGVKFPENTIDVKVSELQQIAIEYEECCSKLGDQNCEGAVGICKMTEKLLPLSPDDYEKALPLIGQEVEFEEDLDFNLIGRLEVDGELIDVETGTIVGKLITPSPIVYSEEEVKEIVRKANKEYNETDSLFEDWWDKHKKK